MSNRRRGNSAENLNLVPFLDLFSTLILFLLATAVWDQLATLPVTLGSVDQSKVQMPQNADVKRIQADLKVMINKDEVHLLDMGQSTKYTREELEGSAFAQVRDFAISARAKYADKRDVVLELADDSVYSDLVSVIDQFLSEDFDQLIVVGAIN